MSQKGLSKGQFEKLVRRVQRRIDNKVPWDLWNHDEQMCHAFYFTGGACPSSPVAAGMQVTETRKQDDVP